MEQSYPGQVEIVHNAFVLVPEERERTFLAYHLQHRAAARQTTGLPFDLPEVGAVYPRSSWPAQEAAMWVAEHAPGTVPEFNLALFEAFFGQTRDISNPEVLADLASRFDLPGEKLLEVLERGTYRDPVWRDHMQAMERGINGIPTVLIGEDAITGAVPYEQYEQSLLRAAPTRRADWSLTERTS